MDRTTLQNIAGHSDSGPFVGLSVMVGVPCYKDMPALTAKSLIVTIASLQRNNVQWHLQMEIGSALVHHARSKIVQSFIESDCTHLMWIDADMVWQADDILRLLLIGKALDCVSAGYREKNDTGSFQVELDIRNGQVEANDLGCVPIKSAGLGFTMMSRKLVKALYEDAEKTRFFGRPEESRYVFRLENTEHGAGGEDILLFHDIHRLGFQTWLDPTIALGHIGTKIYNGRVGDAFRLVDGTAGGEAKAEEPGGANHGPDRHNGSGEVGVPASI